MLQKSRMIIADLNYEYVIPLQTQIAQSYYNQVDLEVITDQEYYSKFLSIPQSVDILLVSNDLYNNLLHKLEIKNLFVLSETNVTIPGVTTIDKYSSVKEILSIVFGKSRKTIYENSLEKKENTKVVVIYSNIGGSGKTSIALELAARLTVSYKTVLYLEANRINTFQGYLKDKVPINDNDVYWKLEDDNESKYSVLKDSIRKHSYYYLPSFKASLTSLNLSYSIYIDFIKEAKAKKDYEYIIVDSDSTFDEYKADILGLADKVIIVTKQDEYSVYALNRLLSNLSGIKSGKYIFICNDYQENDTNNLQSNESIHINEYIEHINERTNITDNILEKHDAIKRLALLLL